MSQPAAPPSAPASASAPASTTTSSPVQETCGKLDTMISDLSNCVINTSVTDLEKTTITEKLSKLKTISQSKIDSLEPKSTGLFGFLKAGKKSKKSKKSKSKTKKRR